MILEHRVLVAGGAGFIGSHLAEYLLGTGVKLLCVDNFFSGSNRNIAHLLDHPNFALYRHDICNPLQLQVDEIYNFASVGSSIPWPETAENITSDTTETSVRGAIHLLELADRCRCRLFHASGSEVYDDPIPEPYLVEAPQPNRVHYLPSYAAGRRYAETLMFNLSGRYGLDFKIGRIFNTYGPRMPLGTAGPVGEFIVRALRGQALTVAGDGGRLHALTYVDDVVSACVRLMDRPRAISGPIDIASSLEISTLALAKCIISLTGSRSNIVTEKSASMPPYHRPDLQPGRETLGLSPATSLESGLLRTIDYFDGLLKTGALSLQT